MQKIQSIKISYEGYESTQGEITWEERDKKTLTLKASKIWIGSWVLGGLSVFLPIAHFFLVPLFIIGGPIMALVISSQKKILLGGKGICPACQKDLVIEKGNLKWPLEELCNGCWRKSKLEPLN